ncbi:MAG: hypothetical protein K6A23_07970 [Butyrivibrio sp.]|nr:hypothetical protein [Butyrivibrio sp.]
MIIKGKDVKNLSVLVGGAAAIAFAVLGMFITTCSYAGGDTEHTVVVNNIGSEGSSVIIEPDENGQIEVAPGNIPDEFRQGNDGRFEDHVRGSETLSVEMVKSYTDVSDSELEGEVIRYSNSLYPETFVTSFPSDKILPGVAKITVEFPFRVEDDKNRVYYIFTMDSDGSFNLFDEEKADVNGRISFETTTLRKYYISTMNLEDVQNVIMSK